VKSGNSKHVERYLRLAELRAIAPSGTGFIVAALSDKPEVRAAMHVRAKMLSLTPRPWDKKYYRAIKGAKGLFEMKWKVEGAQWRVSGYDHGGHFVMLLLYSHKQSVYSPPGWLEISKRNHKDACDRKFDIIEYRF
jgi:hypothetical protein